MGISRRELFQRFGQGAVCLAVGDLVGLKGAAAQSKSAAAGAVQEYDYRKWEDLYRKKWTWDKITHSTHWVGCAAQCEWSVFVKDGIAFKEEQIEHPRSTDPESPDPGPQGCQRGACYTTNLYGPGRLKYPMRRVGKRGEGKWMRVSWDEALTEVADAMLDAISKDQGARSITLDLGDETSAAWKRFCSMMGIVQPDSSVTNGDHNMGYYATFGTQGFEPLPNFPLFNADLIFIWHWNPVFTFIPYYKQFSQARYRGAEIVTVAPDMASAVHADYWIPVEPGTDIALALAMCQVIVEEKLYKPQFLKEQTDLPFLVREDTHKFLRQSDLQGGGKEDQFYIYDLKAGKVVPARKETLDLGSIDPALEGRYEAELVGGKKVAVRPVFERMKDMLNADYKPEMAAEVISKPFAKVHADVIRELARKAGKAKSMAVTTRYNASKSYHVDLINRSIGLFLVLSGHARPGGDPGDVNRLDGTRWLAWEVFCDMEKPGLDGGVEAFDKRKKLVEQIMKEDPTMTATMAQRELTFRDCAKGQPTGTYGLAVPGWQWMYYRAGFKDRWNNKNWHDPHYRQFSSYVEEANQKGWFDHFIGPDTEKTPVPDRVLISIGGNYLRRLTGSEVVYGKYMPSLEKIVNIDFRMSTSALYADLLLPCAANYEHVQVVEMTGWLLDKAVDPPGEAKSDWDISCLLAKKLSERAKQRGLAKVTDARRQSALELNKLYDRYTVNGAYKEGDGEKLADMIYRLGAKLGMHPGNMGLADVRNNNGIPAIRALDAGGFRAFTAGIERKDMVPHPTLTRRMQFYLDHDWHIEAGEALPVHRPHPLLGGDYPMHQTGGHGRESVHTMWITNPLILRLTRGVPSLLMNNETAARLGIGDFEEVEVYNDAGVYRVRVKHSNLVRPNQVIIYHCWEKYQLSKGHWQTVNPCVAKPLMLAGGYGHLKYSVQCWQPEVARRGARVEIRKITV